MRNTDWHKKSWDRFVGTRLPEMLAKSLPLERYTIEERGDSSTIILSVSARGGDSITAEIGPIPRPDDSGVFIYNGREVVFMPLASDEYLNIISCCGEQLADFIEPRLPSGPAGLFSDAESLLAWLPLSEWINEFFLTRSQILDYHNQLARSTHLNRIKIPDPKDIAPLEQIGKVCPVEIPTGPNIGKVLTIAQGVSIIDSRLVVQNSAPEASLGLSASVIPFFERSDPARLVMGANMLRQWLPPLEPQQALVKTGNEPDDPAFWCGVTLLTAFTSVGVATCEDGLVLSESAQKRMIYESPVEVGDKLSTRHGDKGVVSRIVPDDQMPRFQNGRPVDLVFSFAGLHTRMNTGVLFEALAGRIAEKTGKAFIAAPFHSPNRANFLKKLADAGIQDEGMEKLKFPGNGNAPRFGTLVGPIYWGRLHHVAISKLHTFCTRGGQRIGEMEYWILRDAGMYNFVVENVGNKSENHPQAEMLREHIAAGGELPTNFPSSPLRKLTRTLRSAGIQLAAKESGLSFTWENDAEIHFTRSVPHPWLRSHNLHGLTPDRENIHWQKVEQENRRLGQLTSSDAPDTLVSASFGRLNVYLADYMDALFDTQLNDCLPTGRVLFSMRSVIVPTVDLDTDEVGIPEQAAWDLFGPFAAKTIGKVEVEQRSDKALVALDAVMADSWVILNRAPTISNTHMIAFKPVRVPHRSIELNPLVCKWLNADFDGNQAAIYLPISPEAQHEAADNLSIAAHLDRDPGLLKSLLPPHEALWGLSLLWLTDDGRKRIKKMFDNEIRSHNEYLSRQELIAAVEQYHSQRDSRQAVDLLEHLMDLGFSVAACSGASMSPFMSTPGSTGSQNTDFSREEIFEIFESSDEYLDAKIGPQLLFAKAGIRGTVDNLIKLTHSRDDRTKKGHLDGLLPKELYELALKVRLHMAGFANDWLGLGAEIRTAQISHATTVLGRAARSNRPGLVFASAAAHNENDPLTDPDARLFAGLLP